MLIFFNIFVKTKTNSVDMNVNLKVLSVGALFFLGQGLVLAQTKKTDTADVKNIEEVVVVAYGKQKKETFVGSTVSLNSEQIADRANANVTKALDGIGAGVQIATSSGQPGSGISVRIRGLSSIQLSNSPLYIVDGAVYTGGLSDLDPSDIATMTVLKDAASTSLYGASAANGVVMITTKSGRKGRSKFEFSASTGFVDRAYKEYEKLNTGQYYEAQWRALYNGYLVPSATNPNPTPAAASTYASNQLIPTLLNNVYNVPNNQVVIDGVLNPNASLLFNDFDWNKYVQRVGMVQKYNINYGGGDDRTTYYASMGYNKEEGYVIRSEMERYNMRVDVNSKVTNWLKLGGNISGSRVSTLNADSGGGSSYINPFYIGRTMAPIYSPYYYDANGQRVKDVNGNYIYDGLITRGRINGSGRNVIQETLLNQNTTKRDVINARINGEVNLTKDLKFISNLTYDVQNYRYKNYRNPIVGDGAPAGDLYVDANRYQTVTFNQILNYSKKLGVHSLEAIAGHESFNYLSEEMGTSRKGQIMNGIYEIINFNTINGSSGSSSVLAKESYFGRVNYDYSNKYILSGSIRRDASSRFDPNNNVGIFWSVGAGWNIANENFMQNSIFNQLKLRASYGEVGNDGGIDSSPGYNADLNLYSLGWNNAAENGVLISQIGNPELKWESNQQFDVGLDFGLWSNRISGSLEYYKRTTSDMIFYVPIMQSAGISGIYMNNGDSQNEGYEATMNFGIVKNKNFTWNLSANISSYKNKMTKMPPTQQVQTSGNYRLEVGKSFYDYWLRQYYGVDPSDGSALYIQDPTATDDANTRTIDGVKMNINPSKAMYAYSGSSLPKAYGSITNNFDFKGFYLDALVTYQWGGKVYDGNYATLMSANPNGNAAHIDMLNAWQKPGDITNVPKLTTVNTSFATAASTRWLRSSDYVSLRSVTVGYKFNGDIIKDLGMTGLRMYVSGENLWAKTAIQGLEPAQSFGGGTSYRYIPSRIITVGLNASF